MSSRAFILIRNTILTAVYAWLTWGFQQKGNNEAVAMGLTAIASLWVHSGRDKSRTSGGLSVLVPMTCALTLLSACEFQGGTVRLGPASPVIIQPGPVERLRAEYRAQAGLLADSIEFTAAAAPTFTSGRGGIYLLNTDGLFHTVDVAGLDLKLHAAQSYRTSANCSGLSSPANGDVCYDTGLTAFRYYAGGWTTAPTNDALLMHLAGTETVTGNKTFSGTLTASSTATFSGSLILPQTAAPAQTAEGSIVWDTNDDLLTVGDGASRKTMCDLTTAQTLTNKTITAPVLSGTVTGTYTLGGTPTIPASGISGTLATTVGGTGLASFTANRVLYTSSTSAIGQLGCSDGQVITWASGVPSCGSGSALTDVYAGMVFAAGSGAISAGLQYLNGPSAALSGTPGSGIFTAPTTSLSASSLGCEVDTAPSGAETATFTLRESTDHGGTYSDTALACTITGTGKTCAGAGPVTLTQYARYAIKAVGSAGTVAANATCTFRVSK